MERDSWKDQDVDDNIRIDIGEVGWGDRIGTCGELL
jgi:hypothetical protein